MCHLACGLHSFSCEAYLVGHLILVRSCTFCLELRSVFPCSWSVFSLLFHLHTNIYQHSWKKSVINPYHYVDVYISCVYAGVDCLNLVLSSRQQHGCLLPLLWSAYITVYRSFCSHARFISMLDVALCLIAFVMDVVGLLKFCISLTYQKFMESLRMVWGPIGCPHLVQPGSTDAKAWWLVLCTQRVGSPDAKGHSEPGSRDTQETIVFPRAWLAPCACERSGHH